MVKFLRANKEVFTWEPDQLVGVPRGVIELHLRVCPNVHPVKQKARRQSMEKQSFIIQELQTMREMTAITPRSPSVAAMLRWLGDSGGSIRTAPSTTTASKARSSVCSATAAAASARS